MRGQEFDIKTCITRQFLRHWLIEPHGYLHSFSLGGDNDTTVKIVVIIPQAYLYAPVLTIHLTAGHLWHKIPLFRRIVQTNGTPLHCPHAVVDNLYAGVLLVVETSVETVAEHQHVHTLPLKILAVVELQILTPGNNGHEGQNNH